MPEIRNPDARGPVEKWCLAPLFHRAWIIAAVLIAAPAYAQNKSDVRASKHNLSVSGPGPVTSSTSDVCIFCHTPHSSYVDTKPLWDHTLSSASYNTYISTTLNGGVQTPSAGVSKTCLSCHDGTVALGQTVAKGLIPTAGAMSSAANLTTDLSNDHPLGFQPQNDGQLAITLFQTPPVSKDPAVKLPGGRVECTSCHDPHKQNIDAAAQDFLVRTNNSGAVCLACHDPSRAQPNWLNGWTAAAHATFTNTVPAGGAFGPYSNVAQNACGSCHRGHGSTPAAKQRLLRGAEESACSQCHSGTNLSPAPRNVFGEFTKAYTHPALTVSGAHDPAESVAPLNAARHSECADCHNPHAANDTGGSLTPPGVAGPVVGASGFDGGGALRPAINEYQVCFKCHASSTTKPQGAGYSTYGRTISRVVTSYDERLRFNSTASFHNVTKPRTALAVPSLRANMLNLNGGIGRPMGTHLYCTDCHSNDQNRKFGGTGPNGPHGSTYPHLLERRFEAEPPGGGGITYVSGLTGTNALCDKCHDVAGSILSDVSFSRHSRHIISARASCTTCHDPHGIAGGSVTNNKWLMNFDTTIVTPASNGILSYESTGIQRGTCNVTCHGRDHSRRGY